jgi:23S rRNA (uracil1939-C5)-methyltransferase
MTDRIYELTLTGLAYGGDALGRVAPAEGQPELVVFVPFAIPGERVRVRIVEQRRGFARAELLEVLEASPQRVQPRCKHFGVCGGCHYQHMPYELQLKAKADILRDQFRRIGHIDNPPVYAPIACPEPWNYRNQVQFHLADDGRLGYVAHSASPPTSKAAHRSIFPITECHLPEPAINSLWPQMQFDADTGIERVAVRQGIEDELLVALESESADLPELEMEAGISVVHLYEEDRAVMAGSNFLTMSVLGRNFQVSAASFFQVNTVMAEKMVEHVLQLASSTPSQAGPSTVIDIYCGAGLFSAFLAPRCSRLIGIESSASACEDFSVNLDEFDNVELYEDAAENVLPVLDVKPDLILLDPPRTGVVPAALDAIVRLSSPTIIYVSCDPATLARDAARLIKGGYHLRSSTPIDLFPQTYHIESITCFDASSE